MCGSKTPDAIVNCLIDAVTVICSSVGCADATHILPDNNAALGPEVTVGVVNESDTLATVLDEPSARCGVIVVSGANDHDPGCIMGKTAHCAPNGEVANMTKFEATNIPIPHVSFKYVVE